MYIPPPGIPFRILAFESNLVFFSRTAGGPEFNHVGRDPVYPDQYFQLIPGTGQHSGSYLIEGLVSKYRIFSRTSPGPPKVSHISRADGTYDDNYWQFEAAYGRLAGYFRLVNPSSQTVLVSRPGQDKVDNYPLGYRVYDDQYFTFLFTDVNIDTVVYEINEAKILQSTSQELAVKTLTNNASMPLRMGFSFDETTTDTSTFEFNSGFSLTIGAAVKAGRPFVAEGEVKVDGTASTDFTWGNTHLTSRNWKSDFEIVVPAKTIIRADASVTRSKIDIPVTIYSKSSSTGQTAETKATYHGEATWDAIRYTIVPK